MQEQSNDNWDLFLRCQNVISQQQSYIFKLQQELDNSKNTMNQIKNTCQEKQRLIQTLNIKIQLVSHQNQCYRIQRQEKQNEIKKIKQQLFERSNKLEQNEKTLNQIKILYQAKIQKIKTQCMQNKQKNQNTHRTKITMNTYTPSKYTSDYKLLSRKLQQTCQKTLVNSPYLTTKRQNFTHQKQLFKTQEEQQTNKIKKKSNIKQTLKRLQDKMHLMAIKIKQNPQAY